MKTSLIKRIYFKSFPLVSKTISKRISTRTWIWGKWLISSTSSPNPLKGTSLTTNTNYLPSLKKSFWLVRDAAAMEGWLQQWTTPDTTTCNRLDNSRYSQMGQGTINLRHLHSRWQGQMAVIMKRRRKKEEITQGLETPKLLINRLNWMLIKKLMPRNWRIL